MAQTKTQIREILARVGVRPQHHLGQNFLIDANLMNKLVESADIVPGDVVLEVGIGTGSLTELLLSRQAWVVGVELDPSLHQIVSSRLSHEPRLTLLLCDVLEKKSQLNPALVDQLSAAVAKILNAESLKLVSNLPYQVSSPLLVNLLLSPLPFSRMCFSIQKELSDRILSNSGRKQYGPLSILMQSTCSIEVVTSLPRHVFWPVPGVDSVALRLDVDRRNFEDVHEIRRFVDLLRLGFAHRRKTLRYNLLRRFTAEEIEDWAERVEIDVHDRPEALTVHDWLRMFFAIRSDPGSN